MRVTIVDHEHATGTATDAADAFEDPPATCLIVRATDGQTRQVTGDEATEIEPGDTIKILRVSSGRLPAARDRRLPATARRSVRTRCVPQTSQKAIRDCNAA